MSPSGPTDVPQNMRKHAWLMVPSAATHFLRDIVGYLVSSIRMTLSMTPLGKVHGLTIFVCPSKFL